MHFAPFHAHFTPFGIFLNFNLNFYNIIINTGRKYPANCAMKQFYIKTSPFFLAFSALFLICLFLFTNCENPFIDAAFQPKKITFETNGGSDVPQQIVYKGRLINKPDDPQKENEDFLGWFTDNKYFLNEWDFSIAPESDLTLYAKWTDFFAVIIPEVNVSITVPVKGSAPDTTAEVHVGSNFTAGNVSWSPSHNIFLGGQQYTATVTLKADADFVFAADNFIAVINEIFEASVLNNTGSTVTLTFAFPATMEKDIQTITIVSQPANMSYLHGDELDLHGFYVTLVYNDGTSDANIALAAFASKGIYTSVPNGKILEYHESYNNHPITITAGGMSAQTSSNLTIGLRPITSAYLTIAAPVTGQIPNTMVNYSGHFSAGNITWNPAVTDKFLGSIAYTVSVTLTANDNYTFTNGLTTAAINTHDAVVVNNGTTAILSYIFPQTGSKSVIGITITSMPSNLTYTHGQALDLAGLSATLLYNDETTQAVPLANFVANNITTSPAAGVQVSRLTHNSSPIAVIYNNSASLRANTNALTVSQKPITITGVSAVSREYNGTTSVALTGGALQGVETNEAGSVGFNLGSGTIENAGVGDNKQVTTNITLTGSAASNYTVTQPANVFVNITPAQITSASVSVAAPAGNMEPSPAVFSTGDYSATASWLRNGSAFTGTFLNGNDYTSVITLTANPNYTFAGSFTASINGSTATVADNLGSTVVISRVFQTAAKSVSSVAINTQPSNISYTHGQALNLAGLSVILTYNDSTTEIVQLADFASKNITTTPAAGAALSRTDHHHASIIVIYNNSAIRASANPLNITKAPGAAVALQNPSFVSGNNFTASVLTPPATGQSVEYAISTSASAVLTELTWQASPNFTINAHSAAAYYWYARAAENYDYLAGTHSISTAGITFYSVSFNSDGQQFAPAQIVRSGQLAAAPASNPTKAGYGFHGWLNGAAAWNFAANTVTADIILTADFRANQIFSIQFELIQDKAPQIPTGLTFSRSGASGYDTGITITVPTPPAGTTFTNISWQVGNHFVNGNTLVITKDDIWGNVIGDNKLINLAVFVNGVPYSTVVTYNVIP